VVESSFTAVEHFTPNEKHVTTRAMLCFGCHNNGAPKPGCVPEDFDLRSLPGIGK
jgi:hypothetical protein